MRSRTLAFLLLLLSACAAPVEDAGSESLEVIDPGIRFLTFNIRYGTANDGANAWPLRRDLVAALIRAQRPDVLAIQEALDFQLEELAGVLDGYHKIGQHRGGGLKGEFSGLYVLPERLRVIESGHFWLSPTPQQVASRGWDAALPRTASWATLELRPNPRQDPERAATTPAPRFRAYGTHFDHRGAEARRHSAALIAGHAPSELPVVVMGDLNADPSSAPLREFFDQGFASSYLQLHPADQRGTFNGFRDPSGGRRIDYVLRRGPWTALSAETLGAPVNEVWPSDHYAVAALLEL